MSPTVLSILLFVPFFIVAGITGGIFFVSGYKKGPFRALFSLGITVVATVLSLLLSRLISWGVAGPIASLLPDSIFEETGPLGTFAESIVQGIIQVALSLILFSLILFILLIILKCVGNRIGWEKLQKLDEWDSSKKSLKFAGMGIRALDTLVVSFMLLIPLYGVLATAVTPVSKMMEVKGNAARSNNTSVYIETVANHPLVSAYKVGPTAWVMEGLTSFGVNGASLNINEISDVIEGLMVRLEKVQTTHNDEKIAAVKELSDYLRENLVGEEWVYDIVCAVRDMVETELQKMPDPDDRARAEELLKLFDMTQKEFEGNATAVLDFVAYVLENDFIDIIDSEGGHALPEEFYQKFGDLINYSDQAVSLKKLFVTEAANKMYRDCLYRDMDYGYSDTVDDQIEEKADTLVKSYFKDGKVAKEKRVKEAKAFLSMMFDSDGAVLIEAFARHPLFGAASVDELVTNGLIADSVGYYDYAEDDERVALIGELEKHPEALKALKNKLKSYETADMEHNDFGDYASLTGSLFSISELRRDFSFYYEYEIIDYLVNTLGNDLLLSSKKLDKNTVILLNEMLKDVKKTEGDEQYSEYMSLSSLDELMRLVTEKKWPTKSYNVDSNTLRSWVMGGYLGSFSGSFDSTIDGGFSTDSDYSEKIEDGFVSFGSYDGNYKLQFGGGYGSQYGGLDQSDPEYADKLIYADLYFTLENICNTGSTADFLARLVDEKGNDPLGLGKKLSAAQKSVLKVALDRIVEDNHIDPTAAQSNNEDYSDQNNGPSLKVERSGFMIGNSVEAEADSPVSVIITDSNFSSFGNSTDSGYGMTKEEINRHNERYRSACEAIRRFFGA